MFRSYQAVFRSRWRAVWWSAGVLLTAYCTVPSEEQTANGDDLAAIVAQHSAGEEGRTGHANPWALKPSGTQ